MRRALLPLLIVAALAVGAFVAWQTLVRLRHAGGTDTSDVATRSQDLPPFARIELDGNADVTLQQGARDSITYDVAQDGRSGVRARVEGDVLRIAAVDRRRWWDRIFGAPGVGRSTHITVTFRSLEGLALAGAVNVRAERIETPQLRIAASGGSSVRIDDLRATTLRLAGSGALDANLAGQVTEAHFAISGAGQVQADKLQAETATVSVSGVGSVVVRVEKSLRAAISGAGTIEYYGNPEVRESISGIGKVKRREAQWRGGMHVAGTPRLRALA